MKKPVIVLLLLAAAACGAGIYRGWFKVNPQKIEQDEKAAQDAVHHLEQKVKDNIGDPARPFKDKE